MVRHGTIHVNDPPRWAGCADAIEEVGEPLASYLRLLLAEDDARQREQAAAFEGDHDARTEAGLDREKLQSDIEAFRQHHVRWLMLVLRWASEDNPTALQAHLDPVFRTELDRTQEAVMECELRLDRLEAQP